MKISYTPDDQAVIDKINELIQDRSEEICRDYLLATDYGTLSHRSLYKALQEDLELKNLRKAVEDFIATRTNVIWEINYK